MVWLLDTTLIRVGNAAYARDNKSFGLTTFRDRHVRVEGSNLRFRFTGKSGKEWMLKVSDRRIARIVKGAQDLPGQQLFQYLDDDGERRQVASQDVNAYIRDAGGGPFSSKHFRTWGGTVRALGLFAASRYPTASADARSRPTRRSTPSRPGSATPGRSAASATCTRPCWSTGSRTTSPRRSRTSAAATAAPPPASTAPSS